MRMIRKDQLRIRDELHPAQQFYALAAWAVSLPHARVVSVDKICDTAHARADVRLFFRQRRPGKIVGAAVLGQGQRIVARQHRVSAVDENDGRLEARQFIAGNERIAYHDNKVARRDHPRGRAIDADNSRAALPRDS